MGTTSALQRAAFASHKNIFFVNINIYLAYNIFKSQLTIHIDMIEWYISKVLCKKEKAVGEIRIQD
jgi:hypothetical protein